MIDKKHRKAEEGVLLVTLDEALISNFQAFNPLVDLRHHIAATTDEFQGRIEVHIFRISVILKLVASSKLRNRTWRIL
jgi:hypothetical protein